MADATVNVVVLAGTVAADPVARRMPSGETVYELRVSVPEIGRRLLPLPVAFWSDELPFGVEKGARVLVSGKLVRRFYRSGAGARSLTEVIADSLKVLAETDAPTTTEREHDDELAQA